MTTTSHRTPDRPNLPERIERIVRDWPQWSPAERRRMDDIVEEVLTYCREGRGNAFIAWFVARVVVPATMRPNG